MAGDANNLRYLIDSYRDWMTGEGIPIVEGIAVDLNGVTTAPWARLGSGVRGAFVQLRGRGDFVGLHVIDIPPGGATDWSHHLFDEVFYVLSGHGSTIIDVGESQRSRHRQLRQCLESEHHRHVQRDRHLRAPSVGVRHGVEQLSRRRHHHQ